MSAHSISEKLIIQQFIVIAPSIDESHNEFEQLFTFNFLFSDRYTRDKVCPGIDSYLMEFCQKSINLAFGRNKREVADADESLTYSLGHSIADPQKFPAHIHAIFTRDGINKQNAKLVASLAGYKTDKWAYKDSEAPVDTPGNESLFGNESKSGNESSAHDEIQKRHSSVTDTKSDSKRKIEVVNKITKSSKQAKRPKI